jgi:hypothetical protein
MYNVMKFSVFDLKKKFGRKRYFAIVFKQPG